MTVFFQKNVSTDYKQFFLWRHRLMIVFFPAEEISNKLDIPKEFISKILQSLTESGIIKSKKENQVDSNLQSIHLK